MKYYAAYDVSTDFPNIRANGRRRSMVYVDNASTFSWLLYSMREYVKLVQKRRPSMLTYLSIWDIKKKKKQFPNPSKHMTHGRIEFRKFFSHHIINNYYTVYGFVRIYRDNKKLTTRQNNKRLYLSAVYTIDRKIIKYHKIILK